MLLLSSKIRMRPPIHTILKPRYASWNASLKPTSLQLSTAVATASSRNSCAVSSTVPPTCGWSDIPQKTACVHLNKSDEGPAHDSGPLRDPRADLWCFQRFLPS